MKRTKLSLAAILVVILFISTACGGDVSIVGNWGDDRGVHLRLFEDGTGTGLDEAAITWKIDDDILTIVSRDGAEEQYRFEVSAGRLRLYFLNGVHFDSFVRLWQ